jgi:hypothetical protein
MNDMSATIIPKSDQISADDLIAGPVTITITGVTISPGEQPVIVKFDGDNGRPYKPCKSMCRLMVHCWGADAKNYIGRSMTLYRDPDVKWGGLAVGGIRISHMTAITSPITIALTETKGRKKPFVVKPLAIKKQEPAQSANPPAEKRTLVTLIGEIEADLQRATSRDAIDAIISENRVHYAIDKATGQARDRINAVVSAALARFPDSMTDDVEFPGDK